MPRLNNQHTPNDKTCTIAVVKISFNICNYLADIHNMVITNGHMSKNARIMVFFTLPIPHTGGSG